MRAGLLFVGLIVGSLGILGCGGSAAPPASLSSSGDSAAKSGTTAASPNVVSPATIPGGTSPAEIEEQPVAPPPSIDSDLGGQGALAVISVRPRQILSRPEFARVPLQEVLEKSRYASARDPWIPPVALLRAMGAQLSDLEQVTCVIAGLRAPRATQTVETSPPAGTAPANSTPAATTPASNTPAQTTPATTSGARLNRRYGTSQTSLATAGEETAPAAAGTSTPAAGNSPAAAGATPAASAPGDATPADSSEDEVVPMLDPEGVRRAIEDDVVFYGPTRELYVLRFVDRAPQGAVWALATPTAPVKLGEKTYYGQGRDTGHLAMYFPDAQTIIVGEETVVRQWIESEGKPGRLADQLKQASTGEDISMVISPQRIDGVVPTQGPATLAYMLSKQKVQHFTLVAQLDSKPNVRAAMHCGNEADAADLARTFNSALLAMKSMVPSLSAGNIPADRQEMVGSVQKLATGILAGAHLKQDGPQVTLMLANFCELSDIARTIALFHAAVHPDIVAAWRANSVPDETADAAAIRRILPGAIGFSNEEFFMFASGQPTNSQSPSLVAFASPKFVPEVEKLYAAALSDFRILSAETPTPRSLGEALSSTGWLGYCTLVQHEYITQLTCQTLGDTARGVVAFRVPGLYEGKFEYTAQRTQAGWYITRLDMPNRQWSFIRTKEGGWEWRDFYGRVGDSAARLGQPMTGTVSLLGKPLPAGTMVSFRHVRFPEYAFGAEALEEGKFLVEIPQGDYFVEVMGPNVPEKFTKFFTSGITCQIKAGEMTPLNFDLK